MKLGILSDTHWSSDGQLDSRIFHIFGEAEAILHAGDIVDISVIQALEAFRPTYAVHGNCDSHEVRFHLPRKRFLKVEGIKIGIIHGWRRDLHYLEELGREFDGAQIVIFGHSHCPTLEFRQGVMYFNPGSITYPRYGPSSTVGVLELGDNPRAYHIAL
jgi:uncharacterized protein